jgi:hypothetical protein
MVKGKQAVKLAIANCFAGHVSVIADRQTMRKLSQLPMIFSFK